MNHNLSQITKSENNSKGLENIETSEGSSLLSNYLITKNTHHLKNNMPIQEFRRLCLGNYTENYSPSQRKLPQKKKESKNKKSIGDRFIPNRKTSRFDIGFTEAHEINENRDPNTKLDEKLIDNYTNSGVSNNLEIYKSIVLKLNPNNMGPQTRHGGEKFSAYFKNNNIFQFKETNDPVVKEYGDLSNCSLPVQIQNLAVNSISRSQRKISKVPYKVLDAPSLQDDFYLNLIDWSSENYLAVGLSSCVYLWSALTSKVTKLCDLGISDIVTSVSWSLCGTLLGVGTNLGEVQLWDPEKLKKVRVFTGHSARVGTMAWNSTLLSTGSRDKNILYRDRRVAQNYVAKLSGHKQEVCGLKWSPDEQQLSSGGNDNKLLIWTPHSTQTPVCRFSQHKAAVKALAWSHHQHGLLASGGGTADKTIRFWNTLNSTQLNYIDTGSQVCNLMFSKNLNELVSTHGYSLNQIILWDYPRMEKIATLTGHTYRVLYLSMSPDGETIVTGAGDETLRFWNTFPSRKNQIQRESVLIPGKMDFR